MWEWLKDICKKPVIRDEEWKETAGRREENLDGEPEESDDNLWYPARQSSKELDEIKFKTRGKYPQKFPEGAVVHYTAGRSSKKDSRGKTPADLALEHLKWTQKEGNFCYFLINSAGGVYQQFPLDEWGYHAGKSSWQDIEGSVSNELVGIEVMCAGRVNKIDDQRYRAWFTRTDKGDKYYNEYEVRDSADNRNIKKGYYLRFTEDQEQALLDLLYWLYDKGKGRFKIKNIVGHDEIAPARKDDPGASLSMTMEGLRHLVRDEEIARKKLSEKDIIETL